VLFCLVDLFLVCVGTESPFFASTFFSPDHSSFFLFVFTIFPSLVLSFPAPPPTRAFKVRLPLRLCVSNVQPPPRLVFPLSAPTAFPSLVFPLSPRGYLSTFFPTSLFLLFVFGAALQDSPVVRGLQTATPPPSTFVLFYGFFTQPCDFLFPPPLTEVPHQFRAASPWSLSPVAFGPQPCPHELFTWVHFPCRGCFPIFSHYLTRIEVLSLLCCISDSPFRFHEARSLFPPPERTLVRGPALLLGLFCTFGGDLCGILPVTFLAFQRYPFLFPFSWVAGRSLPLVFPPRIQPGDYFFFSGAPVRDLSPEAPGFFFPHPFWIPPCCRRRVRLIFKYQTAAHLFFFFFCLEPLEVKTPPFQRT